MISAGIRDVKNNLSRLLIQVKAGKEIVITERGKPIARIVKEEQTGNAIRKSLAPLVQSGLVVWPSRALIKSDVLMVEAKGKAVSEMVAEDRR